MSDTSPLTVHVQQCIDSAARLSDAGHYTEAAVALQLCKPLLEQVPKPLQEELNDKFMSQARLISERVMTDRADLQSTIAAAADPAIENEVSISCY